MKFRGLPKRKPPVKNSEWIRKNVHSIWNAYAKKTGKRGKFCQMCRSPRAIAHHQDYNKPLEIVWLCPRCHTKAHMGLMDVSKLCTTGARTKK